MNNFLNLAEESAKEHKRVKAENIRLIALLHESTLLLDKPNPSPPEIQQQIINNQTFLKEIISQQ